MDKYYWLKLKKDFFKRHDIRIIESMPNGKDYILFYLKLLCESVDHDGNLRFSDQVPYSEEMLAVVTNTNVDIVRAAVGVFSQLGMMELMDDGTYFMNEVSKMMGTETQWAEKKRLYRENQKAIAETTKIGQTEDIVLPLSDKSKRIEKEIEIDIDKKENNIKEKKHTFGTYGRVKLTNTEYERLIKDFGEEETKEMIALLDEYVESNNNKNKYTNYNLVIRKAIRENWFNKKKAEVKPKEDHDYDLETWYNKLLDKSKG